jgi:transposase
MAEVWSSAHQTATADLPSVGHPKCPTEWAGDGQQPSTTCQHTVPFRGGRPPGPSPPPGQKPTRRRFNAEYKLRILQEADQCAKPGELGKLLRREGLYSSHLSAWRRQRQAGARAALAPKKRGPKAAKRDSLACENQWLHRENQHLQARLRQAEMIIAMQSKISDILGITLRAPDTPAAQLVSTETTGLAD